MTPSRLAIILSIVVLVLAGVFVAEVADMWENYGAYAGSIPHDRTHEETIP